MTALPRLRDVAPYALAALLALAFASERCAGRRQGAEAQRWHTTADSALRLADARRGVAPRLDTVFLTRTVSMAAGRARRDTILLTRTDTLIHVDSVRVLVAEERRECDLVVSACAAQRDSARAEAQALRAALAATERMAGLTRAHWYSRCGIQTGYGVTASPGGTFAHGVQLGAGCRVWP